MASSEQTPLISDEGHTNQHHNHGDTNSDETAPLLSRQQARPASTKHRGKGRSKWRWASLSAIAVLAVLVITIIVLGFVLPPAVKEYAEQAVVIEPTSLSLESLTSSGVRARIQANFRLDGSRVADDTTRRLGRFATAIVRTLGTGETKVDVLLPHYGDSLLGVAVLPPMTLDLVDGHNNQLDFVTEIMPGDAETMRRIVNEWLEGKLDQLKVTGAASLRLQSGIMPLGTHFVMESLVLEAAGMPTLPEYKITNLVFHDVPIDDQGRMGVGANVSLSLHNDYAVGLDVPSLGLGVFVPNCDASEPNIKVAHAVTSIVQVRPKADVNVEASGIIEEIPKSLTRTCPNTELSPLDDLVKHYLHGDRARVFLRGEAPPGSHLPDWLTTMLESLTVPFELPGGSFNNLLRNFSLTDVDFKLPSPFADPQAPEGKPRVSGTARALAVLPGGVNIRVGVDSLRATGDLIYHKKKFGELNIEEWQKANSTMSSKGDEALVSIMSRVNNAPIDITDNDVFADILQKLLFGGDDILLDVKASVDVKVQTTLGKLVLKDIPAEGKIPVKHIAQDSLSHVNPAVGDLRIVETWRTGIRLHALVNMTNVTPYTATIPYVNIHVMKQGFVLGEAIVQDTALKHGVNSDISVGAIWDPTSFGGKEARQVGQRLVSDYLSGKKTTVQLQTHGKTVPSMPALGKGLSRFNITLAAPRLKLPGSDGGGDGFIRDAVFHLLSSTASFMLASPLKHDTLHIERINATAYYNHTEPIGQIVDTDQPFDAPPGLSQTPRLHVDWSPSRVGLGKLREAIGGSLKLDARANVTVRLGSWVEEFGFEGGGIGARVSLLGV
ncbi:hypothetical protein CDD81_3249 [Ophiocordyceps australis]|uniref:Pre-rRNA processing protein n=1 Tax=Ophiocordyceps australis TaxID=1399860 RepID=A0A2C5XJR1_9HYPO|nr:hypothetical protein CDD81_3249 [Ophiocordyceps australis]